MDRRGFLRTLLGGAAVVVAAPIIKPKFFFSFFGTGEVFVPKPVIAGNVLTLLDIVRRMPKDGHTAKIAELMMNPPWIGMADDMPWVGEVEAGAVATIRHSSIT